MPSPIPFSPLSNSSNNLKFLGTAYQTANRNSQCLVLLLLCAPTSVRPSKPKNNLSNLEICPIEIIILHILHRVAQRLSRSARGPVEAQGEPTNNSSSMRRHDDCKYNRSENDTKSHLNVSNTEPFVLWSEGSLTAEAP